MYTESSNYRSAFRFFQNCVGKKLKHNNHFLRRPKSYKNLFRGLFEQNSKKRKLTLDAQKSSNYKFALRFFPKRPREKVKRHFVVYQILINFYLTRNLLPYQTCISNQDKLYSNLNRLSGLGISM